MSDYRGSSPEHYISLGLSIVPIAPGTKGPRDEGWTTTTFTAADIRPDWGIGLRLDGDLTDVDLDSTEAVKAGQRLLLDTGLVHGRPSKPRSHHWYLVKDAIKRKFKDPTDDQNLLEVRNGSGLQTVVPPTTHESGEPIAWVQEQLDGVPASFDAATLDKWAVAAAIAALLAKHWPKGKASRHDLSLPTAGVVLRYFPDKDIALRILETAYTVAGDDEVRDRMRVAQDTLKKLQAGEQQVSGVPSFAAAMPEGQAIADAILDWTGAGERDRVASFNNGHFVIKLGTTKREAVVGNDTKFPPSFESFTSFTNFYQHAGYVGKTPIAKAWLRFKSRRTVTGDLVFAPPPIKAEAEDYNLWRGYAVEPDPIPAPESRCGRYLELVRDVICDGNAEHSEFLLDLMAYKTKWPGLVTGVVPVLRGGQGAGKGTFVEEFGSLFGRHYVQLDKPDHALGKFNVLLSAKLIVFMDEAFWAGDKQSIAAMKRLATERELIIERKGIDPGPEPNYAQLFLATNNDWSWPAEMGDRRGFALAVSDRRLKDLEFFGAVRKEMNDGGREALLAFLLARAEAFDGGREAMANRLRRVPDTAEMQRQKDLTSGTARIDQFLEEALFRGAPLELDGRTFRKKEDHLGLTAWKDISVTVAEWFANFDARFNRGRGPAVSFKAFAMRLAKLQGLGGTHSKGSKQEFDAQLSTYTLGDLETARAIFDKETGRQHAWPAGETGAELWSSLDGAIDALLRTNDQIPHGACDEHGLQDSKACPMCGKPTNPLTREMRTLLEKSFRHTRAQLVAEKVLRVCEATESEEAEARSRVSEIWQEDVVT